ncbi:hypothetical protein EST38_g11587 [Candolleomyces aberdarensis]|uniref:Uncharacterized protein n=1 Tax=Candolleomyces aberdarensis TaxID=2316362 RepID=A0A4Q2D4H6_9AGAR|nr:hypothetical protein EST38_g11587 [Candolleomyces aberdarensis]
MYSVYPEIYLPCLSSTPSAIVAQDIWYNESQFLTTGTWTTTDTLNAATSVRIKLKRFGV